MVRLHGYEKVKALAATRHRPELFPPQVLRRVRLASREVMPSGLLRLGLAGDEFRTVPGVPGLTNSGFDDVVAVCLPAAGAPPLPGRVFPHPLRRGHRIAPGYVVRDYTIAGLIYDGGETVGVVIDVVRHAGGRFSDWAETAPIGTEIDVMNGRRMRLLPRTGRIVACGDWTARPALASLLRHSRDGEAGPSGVVLMPGAAAGDVRGTSRLRLEEVPDDASVASRLVGLASEEPDAYFWLASEASKVTAWRRALIAAGVDKHQVQFSGYWREGSPQR